MKDSRPLSERFDLTYVKRRHLADRWTFPLSLGVMAVLAGVVGVLGFTGDQSPYTVGPLTSAHAMFADDCAKCHAPDPPAVGLAGFRLLVQDDKCSACHDAPLHNPRQSMYVGGARAVAGRAVVMSGRCSVCHVEHRGADVDLSRLIDGTCVQCHADLAAHGRAPGAPSPAQAASPAGSRAIANSVTSFAADHPEWSALRSGRRDGAAIRMGHAKHLNPDLKDGPLTCVSCHQRDESGRYMKPISFEAHCRKCHEGDLGKIDVAPGRVDPVLRPHGSMKELERTVEEKLAALVAKNPAMFVPTTPPAPAADAPPTGGSGNGGGEKPSKQRTIEIPAFVSADEREAWLNERRADAFTRAQTKCGLCHRPMNIRDNAMPGFEIVDPAIPSRWLPRSRFAHSAHAMLDCEQCHAARASTETGDVLLPKISSCRECHSDRGLTSGGAPHDCVLCHSYHLPTPAHEGKLLPGDLLGRAAPRPSASHPR